MYRVTVSLVKLALSLAAVLFIVTPIVAADDPDAIGTVTLGAAGIKAGMGNENIITLSGQNTVKNTAPPGWSAPDGITVVYAVGQTTRYTVLFNVTSGNAGAWTAESPPVANEAYDLWAVATFKKGDSMVTDSQPVGSSFTSQLVNKTANPKSWVVGASASYDTGFPVRSGANAFLNFQGTLTLNAGFRFDVVNQTISLIPVDGGVVRSNQAAPLRVVRGQAGAYQITNQQVNVSASLNYNTYYTIPLTVDPANPPAGAVPHVINLIAKNK